MKRATLPKYYCIEGRFISIHALVKRATYLTDIIQEITWGISIHALVKRATKVFAKAKYQPLISIHALVKRATFAPTISLADNCYFNPRPREEGDKTYFNEFCAAVNFNPRPREEGD